jgi:hypothetical protein
MGRWRKLPAFLFARLAETAKQTKNEDASILTFP